MSFRALFVSASLLVGCGVAEPSAPAAADTGSDLGSDPWSYCPQSEPIEGTECDGRLYRTCSYGDSPVPGCHRFYWCNEKTVSSGDRDVPRWWRTRDGCTGVPSNCPAVHPVDGGACAIDAATTLGCDYPDAALCFCVAGDAGAAWSCVRPGATCPVRIPNAGTDCSGTVTCSYGGIPVDRWCILGAVATCDGDHWSWSMGCVSDK